MLAPDVQNGKGTLTRRLSWQEEVKRAFRDPTDLCDYLRLPQELAARATAASGEFPLFAPFPYVSRMRPGDPEDPLLRQVLPAINETETVPGFGLDPVADLEAQSRPGVIQKYAGRALLITTGACAVNCRYCFRRHFPYSQAPRSIEQWRQSLVELGRDPNLQELILSGGDPLMLRDELLGELLTHVASFPALRRLRIHTRLPVVIPQRVTDELLERLADCRLRPIVVLHINHAQELDEEVSEAVERLRGAGAWILNQAVLLRGVNDSVEALRALSESLVDRQIVPYYLHQLDRVHGAAHFEVAPHQGRQLVEQLRRWLPGYAVPRYVQDEPGEASKRWLA